MYFISRLKANIALICIEHSEYKEWLSIKLKDALCANITSDDSTEWFNRNLKDIIGLLSMVDKNYILYIPGAHVIGKGERYTGKPLISYTIQKGYREQFDFLVDAGVDLTQHDDQGNLPLYHAIDEGNRHMITRLIKALGISPSPNCAPA